MLVNVNKLKPYKYMDKEVHNQNISKLFYLESLNDISENGSQIIKGWWRWLCKGWVTTSLYVVFVHKYNRWWMYIIFTSFQDQFTSWIRK